MELQVASQSKVHLGMMARGYAQETIREDNRVTGPRYYPSLAHTLRNIRGRELLRIVDTAVPNLTHINEFLIVLKALAVDGQWRRAKRLIREMGELGITQNLITFNQVLQAMCKDRQADKALEFLEEMRESKVEPNVESYAHCIGACKISEWQRTMQIMEDIMPEDGLEPDGACFEHALAACEEAGEWQRSLSLFMELQKRGLESTSVGHNYALRASRNGKQWRHGLEIMTDMAQRSYEPDFRVRQDIEAQSRGLERAPPPEPSQRASSPDNVWQRKQQLRELREQDKRRQEERKIEQEKLEREPAPAPFEDAGFMVYGGQDSFAHQNAHTMSATDIDACRRVCQERAYGAFTVWSGQAFFRNESPDKIQAGLKRAAGTTLYVNLEPEPKRKARLDAIEEEKRKQEQLRKQKHREEQRMMEKSMEGAKIPPALQGGQRSAEARWDSKPQFKRTPGEKKVAWAPGKPRPKLRSPGSYVLPVFAQHDRSNHAERQALIKVIARVQEACGAQNDAEFEKECADVTGTVRLYASHTPCISCMACFCQFQRLFPKVKLCVDFDDWRDTRRMVEMARREEEYKKRGLTPPNYDCPGISDMSDEEEVRLSPEEVLKQKATMNQSV